MRLEGTHLFAAPRSAVWEALMDPTVLAQALPGGEAMEQTGDNQYRAVMNVKLGAVQGRFEGKIELSDIVAPERYRMKVDGQGAPGFVAGEGTLELTEQDGSTLLTYAGDVTVGGRVAGVGQRLIESTARSVTRQGLTALDQMVQARLVPAAVAGAIAAGDAGASAVPGTAAPARSETVAVTAGNGAVPTPVLTQPTPSQPALAQPGPAQPGSTGPGATGTGSGVDMANMAGQVVKDVARDLLADYVPPDKQERVVFFGLGALAMLIFVVLVRLVQKD